jgi:hypothetical protein
MRGGLRTGAIAIGVLLLGLAGGALSGKFEHRAAATHPTGSLPPVVTDPPASAVSSTMPPGLTAVLGTQLVEDLSLDVGCQRLDPDKTRRAALAATAVAVATRHREIATAWVPEKVARIEAAYDTRVHDNAIDPNADSVTSAQFVVTKWSTLTSSATATTVGLTGHYRLTEPTNAAAQGGVIEQHDQAWTVTVRMSAGRWRLVNRSAT